MSSKWTKDERFVLCAFEAATAIGDYDSVVDRYLVGKTAGLSPKAVDTICNLLAQANFIRKLGPIEMKLTSNGETLARQLREQH